MTLSATVFLTEEKDCNNLYFCFRWLLVHFKREFSYDDIMSVWEVRDNPRAGCFNFIVSLCTIIIIKLVYMYMYYIA